MMGALMVEPWPRKTLSLGAGPQWGTDAPVGWIVAAGLTVGLGLR